MRQAKGKGGESAVMAEADLRGEWPILEEDAGGARLLGVFPDFKIVDREAQTAGDLDEELHPDKRRRITGVFAIAHMFEPVNASRILRGTHAIHTLDDPCQTGLRSCRQGVNIVIRHNDTERHLSPGGKHPAGKAAGESHNIYRPA